MSPTYNRVEFYLPFDNFERSGTPAATEDYVDYRDKVLEFMQKRSHRVANRVRENHPDIDVRE